MMSRLQRPRRTSSSFAASISMCQLERNCSLGFNSRNDRWMNAHRSCRRISAYILAGLSAILVLAFFLRVALFHSFVDRADDFDIGFADREMARLKVGGTGFDFVNPVKEPTDRPLIAASGFSSKLHCRCL